MEHFSIVVPVSQKSLVKIVRLYNWRLLVAVSVASMFSLNNGCLWGYPSPAMPDLNRHRNPFRVTDDQQSWFGSLLALGAAAGGLATGHACDLLGRKVALMSTSLFTIVGFTIISAATDFRYLYAGMSIACFFAQINLTAATLYTAEVSPIEIRGTCVAITVLTYSIGMVVMYAMGVVLRWNWLVIFMAALYAAPNVVLAFLPESPRWFLLKGNREAAIHGIKWFQGVCDVDEINAIARDISKTKTKMCDVATWKELVVNGHNRKSLFVCVMLFIFQGISGNAALQTFTVTIFEMAGASSISPNLQTIISGLSSVVGSLICPLLVDRVGRKVLMIASTAIVCVSMASVGAFFQVLETRPEYALQNLSWLPVVGLSLSNLGFAVGLLPVPYILSCELFPTNVRGCAQTVSMMFLGLAYFGGIKTFINLEESINASGAFFVYTCICAVATLFVVVFVNDSKPCDIR